MNSIRLRDFVEDREGCLYAVSNYDNADRVGCILRYVPMRTGSGRASPAGWYRKYDFAESFAWVGSIAGVLDSVHRVPYCDVVRVYKPEEEIGRVAARNARVRRLLSNFNLPKGSFGCTGSLSAAWRTLHPISIWWSTATPGLPPSASSGNGGRGVDPGMSTAMWRKVYDKRVPEISFEAFVLHEQRKWNGESSRGPTSISSTPGPTGTWMRSLPGRRR
jgi:predicted nucleotidyltransferase